ncbi:amino acid permease-domain-containing protein [Fusarium venenatum]|uniref:amino acid permease-domain-containing protein n=1 Tax=Fusarium venenatum TaxID=56646 RepID=UPI001D665A84|nr:amino acid permease-domain-containing protein [Fusarium venenatum]
MASETDIPAPINGPFKARAPDYETNQEPHEEGLGSFDVFSLIVNKMIGTGIYTSPAVVYRMTGSKSITLALFGVGFVYCLMSTAIYLQYAHVLPYNGGELIYLDEITSSEKPTYTDMPPNVNPQPENIELQPLPPGETRARSTGLAARSTPWYKKLLGDGLLAYIIYSLAFIFFFNSATNSQQFGRMILLCLHADKEDNDDDIKKDQHLMRYIAVSILSIICLAQFFSPAFGRRLNKFLAVVKIGFLVGLVAVGLAALGRDFDSHSSDGASLDRGEDWSERREVRSKVSFAKALLVVLFSFEGWENATFVAGEIPPNKQQNLRRGFLAAAFTVGSLYMIVVAVSLNSLSWEEVKDANNINYAPMLSRDTATARRAWAIIISISAFGSLNAIIYTFSRVKQVIGQAEVLPWSHFLKKDDCLDRKQGSQRNAFRFKSPQGGLIAHWLASVVWIAVSASIQSTLESIGLAGYIQTYTHCFILMVLGFGYFKLKSRQEFLNSAGNGQQSPPTGRFVEALVLVGTPIYILLNLAIIVINAVPPYKSTGDDKSVFPGYGYPVIVASLVTLGTLYYLLFFGAVCRSYESISSDDDSEGDCPRSRVVEGIFSAANPLNLMKHAGVVCEMKKDYSYNKERERVFRFGRRWRMIYSLEGYDYGVRFPLLSHANIVY